MFGNKKQKEKEAAFRKKISVDIPAPTLRDQELLDYTSMYKTEYLDYAVQEGSLWCVYQLLLKGADVNYHARPLQDAIRTQQKDMLRLLLQAGADRHKETSYYLRDAIEYSNDDAVDLLLQYDTDIDAHCIFVALKNKRPDLAQRLLSHMDEKDIVLKDVLRDALDGHNHTAVTWIKDRHPSIWETADSKYFYDAVAEGPIGFFDVLDDADIEKLDVQKLTDDIVKQGDFAKLTLLIDRFDDTLDYQGLMQSAIASNKEPILNVLEAKGAKLTSMNIIIDCIRNRNSRYPGEEEREFETRKKLLSRVTDDVTRTNGYLLSYMMENNKHRTVKHLLQTGQKWPDAVVQKGLVDAARKGYRDVITHLMLETDQWDAQSFHRAMIEGKKSGIVYHLDALKKQILGEDWEIESDDTIRRVQKFETDGGEGFVLSQIFNFKSAEVIRVTGRSYENKGHVDCKNFRDFQNDNAIHEAYNKLAKFSRNPPAFSGAHLKNSTRTRRVIKRRPPSSSPKK